MKKGAQTLRTCSLRSNPVSLESFRIYYADYKLKFKNSPRCVIQPEHKSVNR